MSYFPEIPKQIPFEGRDSKNPLAFRFYQADKVVGGKTMAEHLRFAVCYWHTFVATGNDPFGVGTLVRPWLAASDPIQRAKDTMDAAFEFKQKLGVEYWCFHDRDIAPEGANFDESCKILDEIVNYAEGKQKETGIKLLWGTANLFSNPRYMAGAATNPDPNIFAYAGAQVRHAMDATKKLEGLGYTFWGGREGYDTLLNTDLKQEREQLAMFLHMAVLYARTIHFEGQFYIEPKPKEPTTHQYDSSAESCLNFLREFKLLDWFKLNLETNHATLAGHTMGHEMRVARHANALGSVDANTGDELIGWDTDQFPTDIYLATEVMTELLEMGGFTTGGLNFDAKVRRQSFEPIDLFYSHIGAMDTFARGLEIAIKIREEGRIQELVKARYAGWGDSFGERVMAGHRTLEDCEDHTRRHGEPSPKSGRQERFENLINEYIL